MNGNDHLRQTLDYYRQQYQKKLEELRPLDLMIRQLERELGEAQSGTDSLSLEMASSFPLVFDSTPASAPSSRSDIRPDEFYGMSQSEAAKVYLKKVGRAISLDDLVTALNRGGAKVGGANPKKTLYVSLMRNPMREFVSPSENHIGLRAFYPGLPKTEKAKTSKTKKPKKAKILKNAAKKTGNGTAPKVRSIKAEEAAHSPIKAAIADALRDGAKSKEEILQAVELQIPSVEKIAVFGALRSKQFVEADGKIGLA